MCCRQNRFGCMEDGLNGQLGEMRQGQARAEMDYSRFEILKIRQAPIKAPLEDAYGEVDRLHTTQAFRCVC